MLCVAVLCSCRPPEVYLMAAACKAARAHVMCHSKPGLVKHLKGPRKVLLCSVWPFWAAAGRLRWA